jgi:hypothetical protein
MVDDSGDNTAVLVAYKMPPTANPTTIKQQVSGNQANSFGQPFTTYKENVGIIENIVNRKWLIIPVLTMQMPRTHMPIANGTATLGKLGSAMGM